MALFNGAINESLYQKSLTETETDLLFRVGPESEKVHAHSLIVLESSAVFKAMLSGRWDQMKTEAGVVVVDLPDDDPEDFKTLVKLMYGYAALTLDDWMPLSTLYRLADKYEASEVQKVLSDLSVTLAQRKLSVGNVFWIYVWAKECRMEGLVAAAIQYMASNIFQLWKHSENWLHLDTDAMIGIVGHGSLCALDLDSIELRCVRGCCKPRCNNSNCARTNYYSQNEKLLLEKVVEWIKHNDLTNTEGDGFAYRVVRLIRFHAMTPMDFLSGMEAASEVLTATEIGQIVMDRLRSTVHDGMTPLDTAADHRAIILPNIHGWCTTEKNHFRFFFRHGIYHCSGCVCE